MIRLATSYAICTLKNRVLEGVKRLKKPRYAIGLLAVIAYFVLALGPSLYFGRPARLDRPISPSPIFGSVVCLVVLWTLWQSGRTPAVGFQKSELMFLLTSPVTRRQILLFWIINLQPRLMVGGLGILIVGFLFFNPISTWLAYVAAINALLSISLLAHQACALAMARGRPELKRGPFWVAVGALLGTVLWTVRGHPYTGQGADYPVLLADSEPLKTVLSAALGLRPMLSASPAHMLRGALFVLGFAAACFGVACLRPAPFEEASLAQADGLEILRTQGFAAWRRHRRASEMARRGGIPPQPFDLGPRGNPTTALVWKTLIGAGRNHRPRTLVAALAASIVASAVIVAARPASAGYVAGVAVYLLGLVWLFMTTRLDLRQELPHFAVLRSYPLSGRHIVRGSTLALSSVLSSYTLVVLAAVCVLTANLFGHAIALSTRIPLVVAAWISACAASYLLVAIGNTLIVLWPGWAIRTLPKDAGITQFGTNLLAMLFRYLPFLVAWIVPGVAGALTYFALHDWLSLDWPFAVLCASLPAAVLVFVEAELLLLWAAAAYAKVDIADL